jgi:hypothetical protein
LRLEGGKVNTILFFMFGFEYLGESGALQVELLQVCECGVAGMSAETAIVDYCRSFVGQ